MKIIIIESCKQIAKKGEEKRKKSSFSARVFGSKYNKDCVFAKSEIGALKGLVALLQEKNSNRIIINK